MILVTGLYLKYSKEPFSTPHPKKSTNVCGKRHLDCLYASLYIQQVTISFSEKCE